MTTFPTIHINGTSKQELIDGYKQAVSAIQDAIDTIGKEVTLHGRDYYVQDDNAYYVARDQHAEALKHLADAQAHFMKIAIHLVQQGT